MKKFIVMFGSVLALAPVVALAQTTGGFRRCAPGAAVNDITTFLCKVGDILSAIIPILIILAVVYFIWGVISYVIAGDEEAKKSGREKIIYGIIGLAVIVGVWGLVRILTNTFGVDSTQNITFPTTPY